MNYDDCMSSSSSSSSENSSELLSEEKSPATSSPPPAMPQTLFDLLHASIDAEKNAPAAETPQPDTPKVNTHNRTETEDAPLSPRESFGQLLRMWRLRHGYTRAQFAAQLQMDPIMLLGLEQELILPQSIAPEQLSALVALIISHNPPQNIPLSNLPDVDL